MWSDPWWVLGWLVVGLVIMAVAIGVAAVTATFLWSTVWALHVVRDTRRWERELPKRSTWYKVSGDTVTVLAQREPAGLFTLDTGAALHLHKKPAQVVVMLKQESRRAMPWEAA